jgi:hypothetical protein
VGEKIGKTRGSLANMPSSSSPTRYRTERRRGGAAWPAGRVPAGGSRRGGGLETGGKERGGRGEPIPVLTSSYCARWRRLHGRAEAAAVLLVAAARCSKGGSGVLGFGSVRRGGGGVVLK